MYIEDSYQFGFTLYLASLPDEKDWDERGRKKDDSLRRDVFI